MTYHLHLGDCLDILPTLPADSVDSCITDPPYGLTFMGNDWDHGVPGAHFWAEVLRVCKPGAMLIAFGGTRTFHRLTCAIEDAGWEIRDCLMWLYGSGFPKSHDISKGIDAQAGVEREVVGERDRYRDGIKRRALPRQRAEHIDFDPTNGRCEVTAPATPAAQEWHGWGTALKPAWEPIILAMKPPAGTFAQNALAWGVAGLNIDGARVPANGDPVGANGSWGFTATRGWNPNNVPERQTIAQRTDLGRWPANLLLNEAAAALLDQMSGETTSAAGWCNNHNQGHEGWGNGTIRSGPLYSGYADTGGASRFFFVAKASRREREAGLDGLPLRTGIGTMKGDADGSLLTGNGNERDTTGRNHHPTVKPLRLMEYLCTLTATPTGGVVLDPFMGSGTTGMAAIRTGRTFVGIEKEADYLEIARRRIAWATLPLWAQDIDEWDT